MSSCFQVEFEGAHEYSQRFQTLQMSYLLEGIYGSVKFPQTQSNNTFRLDPTPQLHDCSLNEIEREGNGREMNSGGIFVLFHFTE